MGEVYLAQDTDLERTVALKILPADVADDKQRMQRFVREAKTASALNHPNILTIFEIGHADATHFIATEFIEGETLREHMKSAGMKISEMLNVAIQTADAIAAAHEAGIIHRDIKPENIMLRRRDSIVKVLDFGLAKLPAPQPATVDTEAATKSLFKTDAGVVLGTALYMSPEQARGEELDARTDLFSFGAVLYEMATGRPAFPGQTSAIIFNAILSQTPILPSRLNPDLPPKLEEIINKALEKDREVRYQSSADLRADLKRLKRASDSAQAVAGLTEVPGVEPSEPGILPSALSFLAATPRRWWEANQLGFLLFNVFLVYLGWLVKEWTPGSWGLVIFFAVVVCSAASTSLRIDLLGTAVVNPKGLGKEVKRLALLTRGVDLTFTALLFVLAVTIATAHTAVAAFLVGMSVAGLVAFLILEPAIARVAFPQTPTPHATQTTPITELLANGINLHKRGAVITLGVLALAAALAYVLVFRRATTSARPPEIKSLAVLPLENLSGDPAQEYFADGMTEALITDLAQISALKVISRTSVMQYKSGHRPPLPQIARELNVDAVIEGSVQRSGDQVRITAQLIYAPTDKHLWARTYDRDLRNILSLESEVAQAIAQEIQVKLTPAEESRLASSRPVDPAALEAYLRGLYNFREGRDNLPAPAAQEQLHQAIAYLQQAIQIDPNYAPAYSALAGCEEWLASWTAFGVPGNRQALFEAARGHALKAIQLDESLAEAHAVLAWVLFAYDWKFSDSQKEYRRANELNPGQAYPGYYYLLTALGRLDEAKAEAERAMQLDPLTLAHKTAAAAIYNCAGQYDRAASLAVLGERVPGRVQLGIARVQQGATEEGIAELRRIVELTKGDPFFVSYLAWAYQKVGRRNEAVRLLEEAKARSHGQPVRGESMAMLYAAVGDKDHALEWLQKAVQQRDLTYVLAAGRCDPRLESLRGDSRFADLIRRIGLPQ